MYFTWNFLARIFVIYIATRNSCDGYLSMFTITMPFPHETKLLASDLYLSHSECGEFNRLCTLPFFASMGLCFLGTWAFFFFSKHILFCLRFRYLTINQCYLLIYRDLFSTYFLLLDKIVILTFNLPKSFDNFWIYFTD